MAKKLFLAFFCNILMLTLLPGYIRADKLKEIPLPHHVAEELSYVLKFIKPANKRLDFRPAHISNLLGFVAEPKTTSELHHAGNLFGMPSAYHGMTLKRPLAHILRYAYNSDIPFSTMAPSTVRICRLKQTAQGVASWPRLWKLLSDLDRPITVTGTEHIVNTPDLYTGVYYAYDQDRALILFTYQGKNALVSISKQHGKSEVGKKGLVLGADEDWNYIYTGETGLTKSGLGWVRSYMYESIGVTVYYEMDPGKPMVRLGVFRWVRAGWAGLNMVDRKHIFSGLQRFARAFKKILEYPQLPQDDVLAHIYSQIERLPAAELRQDSKNYLENLKRKYNSAKEIPEKWRKFVFEDNAYLTGLTEEEMKSILFVERLKKVLESN